ncbi:hypothetical protein GDO86_014240, partial [Hymenochirus boettgeri]
MANSVSTKRMFVIRGGQIQFDSSSGGHYKKVSVAGYASSVYGGAGGLGTKISTAGSHGRDIPSYNLYSSNRISVSGNDKETMQNLNNRLATYLDKVHLLEKANAQLEGQIRDWYSKNSGPGKRDDKHYFETMEDLTTKIENAKLENARILLQVDNARLATDDFKIKLASEQSLRASVEIDIIDLRKVIDELTMTKSDLECQVESVKEELIYLRKNHNEEIDELQKQSRFMNVEVDAAPSNDLAKTMEEMRSQYEKLVEQQRLEAKYWFDKKVEECSVEIQTSTSELENYKQDLSDLKHKSHDLEIQFQAELSKRKATAGILENVNSEYMVVLVDKQRQIGLIEEQLKKTRKDVNIQIQEFDVLFDLKTRLEAEISTYRSLLDAE